MMNAKTIALWSLPILFLTGSVALAAGYHGGGAKEQGANYNAQAHEKLESAIDARDYDAWLKVRQEYNLPMHGRVFQVINKDNFAVYAQLHDANEAGDLERAAQLRTELGIAQGGRGGRMGGRMGGTSQHSCQHGGQSGMGSGAYSSGACGMGQHGAGQQGRGFVDANGDGLCDRMK